jgi:hypothetical protein
MRKAFTLILALLYISTSTGAVIHMHYCMGKMSGWGLIASTSDTCGKCGMEKLDKEDNGCCKDEIKLIKNESDQKSNPSAFQLISLVSVSMPSAVIDYTASTLSSLTEEKPVSHAPPRCRPVAVYILHRSFLI